jgi:hypothetical protein
MRTKKLNSRSPSLNFSLQTLRRARYHRVSPQFSSPLSSFIHQQVSLFQRAALLSQLARTTTTKH